MTLILKKFYEYTTDIYNYYKYYFNSTNDDLIFDKEFDNLPYDIKMKIVTNPYLSRNILFNEMSSFPPSVLKFIKNNIDFEVYKLDFEDKLRIIIQEKLLDSGH